MKTAGVAELKAHLSRYLAAVKEGEDVLVTDRGKPVARLVPLAPEAETDARLAELVRLGLAKPPSKSLDPLELLSRERAQDPGGRVLEALLEERRDGR